MRIRRPMLTIGALSATAALVMLPTAPASAATPTNFGSHVSACAHTMGFSGTHNPGMHRGAAGWDGASCDEAMN